MALPVPAEPKVYTTKYANLRGVDYTNDASNVWYRRSPNGLNMLPNLDGQPYKRNGWKIEFAPEDFIEASGVVGVTDVVQYKVDYFELGGTEYLWFYTSLGCFYYDDSLKFVDKSYEISDPDGIRPSPVVGEKVWYYRSKWKYNVGDLCYYIVDGVETYFRCNTKITTPEAFNSNHWTALSGEEDCWKAFPPTRTVSGEETPCDIDYSKSFFFEGQGRAAYYLFADDKMYWFDGEKLHEAHPHVPIVLTMCDNKGVGTPLENVNLLTPWRCIEYTCSEGATEYTIPDGFDEIFGVYLHTTGKYEWNMTELWDEGQNPGTIVMRSVPPETFVAQVNLRIIYKPAGASIIEKSNVKTASKQYVVKKTTVTTQQQIFENGVWKNFGSSSTKTTFSNATKPTFSLSNPKKPLTTYVLRELKNASGTWVSTGIGRTFNSYGNKVTLGSSDNGKSLYDAYPSIKASTTTKVTYSGAPTKPTTKIPMRKKYTTTVSTKTFNTRINYTQWIYNAPDDFKAKSAGREAFFAASKVLIFGNGIINQVFLTASSKQKYNTRVWYSAATNPYYFPDTNYIEVGSTDKSTMGLIRVGDYLGIIKQGGSTDTSVYLAYPTSFENITTYAVKQSVNGVGAVSNGAFNVLNDEPLFLSAEGLMGIEPGENDDRKIRNRSYYINKKLLEEPALESAVSFVFKGMYWLCVNNHCYVLDGSQKTSWENTKTNLQYECYYLDNIPAKCFAKKDGRLWFIDSNGNVCRFRDDNDDLRFVDWYDVEALSDETTVVIKAETAPTQREDGSLYYAFTSLAKVKRRCVFEAGSFGEQVKEIYLNGLILPLRDAPDVDGELLYIDYVEHYADFQGEAEPRNYILEENTDFVVTGDTFENAQVEIPAGVEVFNLTAREISYLREWSVLAWFYYIDQEDPALDVSVGNVIQYNETFYSVTGVETNASGSVIGFVVSDGVPIKAVWGTIADDDGSAHYYKKLQKKGSLVALMPMSDSGVKAWVIKDEEDPIFVGETDAQNHILPFNYYLRKKVKKYKRLQIVVENDSYNDGFGIDEIIKSYTVGNYAKK